MVTRLVLVCFFVISVRESRRKEQAWLDLFAWLMICPLMKLIRRFLLQGIQSSSVLFMFFDQVSVHAVSQTCHISWRALWNQVARGDTYYFVVLLATSLGFQKSLYFPDFIILYKGCPILQQIYAWHCIVLDPPNDRLTIQFNREWSNTIECNTMPCINLSEYWTIL